MEKAKKSDSGFTVLEALVAVVIVALLVFAGWAVHKNDKKAAVASEATKAAVAASPTAKKLTSALSTGQVTNNLPATTNPTPIVSTTPMTTTSLSFVSKYDGFQFHYPSDWSGQQIENDSSGAAYTVTGPGSNVLVSYGSPVEPPSATECAASQKLQVYSVQSVAISGMANTRQLYLVEYSDQDLKSVALTDWDGTQPTVGRSSMCSGYQPAFLNQTNGAYIWFKISDESQGYRQLDATSFFNESDVQAAISIIQSGK